MTSGGRYERRLARALEAHEYAVMRAGASGSGTASARPDVLAARDGGHQMWATEVKYTSGTTAYADPEEVDALIEFAERFGATPVIVVRFKGTTTFWFVPPEACRMTDAGTYGVPHDDVRDRATYWVEDAH